MCTYFFNVVVNTGMQEVILMKVLNEIAHFHAATYHYLQQYPGGMEALRKKDPSVFMKSFYDLTGTDQKMKDNIVGVHQSLFKNSSKVS